MGDLVKIIVAIGYAKSPKCHKSPNLFTLGATPALIFRNLLYENECDDVTRFLAPKLGFPPGRMSGKPAAQNDWTMKKYEKKTIKIHKSLQ